MPTPTPLAFSVKRAAGLIVGADSEIVPPLPWVVTALACSVVATADVVILPAELISLSEMLPPLPMPEAFPQVKVPLPVKESVPAAAVPAVRLTLPPLPFPADCVESPAVDDTVKFCPVETFTVPPDPLVPLLAKRAICPAAELPSVTEPVAPLAVRLIVPPLPTPPPPALS